MLLAPVFFSPSTSNWSEADSISVRIVISKLLFPPVRLFPATATTRLKTTRTYTTSNPRGSIPNASAFETASTPFTSSRPNLLTPAFLSTATAMASAPTGSTTTESSSPTGTTYVNSRVKVFCSTTAIPKPQIWAPKQLLTPDYLPSATGTTATSISPWQHKSTSVASSTAAKQQAVFKPKLLLTPVFFAPATKSNSRSTMVESVSTSKLLTPDFVTTHNSNASLHDAAAIPYRPCRHRRHRLPIFRTITSRFQ